MPIDYKKSCIYKISSNLGEKPIIGGTTSSLAKTLHKYKATEKNKQTDLTDWENRIYTIEEIEQFPCKNKMELNARVLYHTLLPTRLNDTSTQTETTNNNPSYVNFDFDSFWERVQEFYNIQKHENSSEEPDAPPITRKEREVEAYLKEKYGELEDQNEKRKFRKEVMKIIRQFIEKEKEN